MVALVTSARITRAINFFAGGEPRRCVVHVGRVTQLVRHMLSAGALFRHPALATFSPGSVVFIP